MRIARIPVFYTDPSGNVCPEGTKDPLLHAPVPSPNQQQSTALVPYDPEFAAKQMHFMAMDMQTPINRRRI